MVLPEKLTYGSYEVVQNPDGSPCLLGRGGFGATYKARHVLLRRITALKVIREDKFHSGSKDNLEETQRFQNEARAVSKLLHPGIAVVHDCALDDDVFYYAMEYCDGGSLQQWCEKNGPMPWPDVRVLVLQIASALDYAHANGILHRDIKPANIMLNGQGNSRQAKIIDFGLAQQFVYDRESSSGTVRNDQENFRGSYITASPEQVREEPLDPRSDLFSLGVTLWWLLVGKNPFGDLKHGRMLADRTGSASYASSLPDDLVPEARRLLEGLLEKDVDKRTATALDVIEQLNGGGGGVSVSGDTVGRSAVDRVPLQWPSDWQDGYAVSGSMDSTPLAKLYNVQSHATGQALIAIIPEASLDPRARSGMRVAASRLLDFGAYAFLDWRSSGGDDVFVISKPEGCRLLDILRKFGPAKFADALPLLSHLARCFDVCQAWTTFGIRVEAGDILVRARNGGADIDHFQAWSDLDPQAIRCLPFFASGTELADTGSTIQASAQQFLPLAQFAALVYRVLNGSAVKTSAFISPRGYVMASGLSEDGNGLLAETIWAPQTQPSACRFVHLLASLESLHAGEITPLPAAPSAHDIEIGQLVPTGAPASVSSVADHGRLSGGAVKPAPLDTPVADSCQAAATEIYPTMALRAIKPEPRQEAEQAQRLQAEAIRQASEQAAVRRVAEEEARRKQEEAKRLAAEEKARRQPEAKPRTVEPAPPVTPVAASVFRNRRKVIAIAAVLGAVVTIVTVFVIKEPAKPRMAADEKKHRNDDVEPRLQGGTHPADGSGLDEKPPSPDVTEPDRNTEPAGSAKSTDSVKPTGSDGLSSVVKVPGDVKSVAEAVKRCREGGTIEISGGPYYDALLLTQSVSLVSASAAMFEDRGIGTNLIIASGPIQVILRNIQIKNTREEAKSPPESSPALVLIKDGASIRFEGGGIEGSVGNGVSLADKATATFSNSTIRNNRGYGINVSSASKVEISLSAIRENRSGIALANVGSTVTLGNGTTVEANSQHGVEVGNGAMLQCDGAAIHANEKVGLIVEGSGSQARLGSSCVISANRKYGVLVRKAGRLVMSDTSVADNSEHGLFAESAAQVEILSCQFKSNGAIGAYLVNGPSSMITISKSVFQSHSDAGAAFIEGIGKVTECNFSSNKMAVFFGKGSRGSATGNTMYPGPIEDVLVLEEAGEVKLGNNTIDTAR